MEDALAPFKLLELVEIKFVLILVVMEDALALSIVQDKETYKSSVLILVVMEDALALMV